MKEIKPRQRKGGVILALQQLSLLVSLIIVFGLVSVIMTTKTFIRIKENYTALHLEVSTLKETCKCQ